MAAMRDIGGLRPLITVIGVLILITGAQTDTRKEVGGSVTLNVPYTGEPREINWKKDGKPVVDMILKPRVYITFTLLKDRASISDITGGLTIRNLIEGDSGLYTAEVIQDGGQINTIRTELIVAEKIRAKVGESVTLNITYTGNTTEITWRKDGKLVVDMKLNPLRDITFTLLQDRASINNITGSLTIRNLIKGDSGLYTATVIQDGGQTNKTHKVLIVFGETEIIRAEEGQTITLPVTYTGDLREITWKKDGGIVGKIQLIPQGAPYLYILQDRATVSDAGSLTIKNLIKGDSGNYTAEVTQDGGQIDKIYMELIVVAESKIITAKVGQAIILPVSYTSNTTLITWKKDGNNVGRIQLNPPGAPHLYILQDRASISDTGSLTIRDLIKGDSGLYTAEVIQDGGQINTIRTELIVVDSCTSPWGYIVTIIFLIIIIILGLLCYFYPKNPLVQKIFNFIRCSKDKPKDVEDAGVTTPMNGSGGGPDQPPV